MDEAERIIGQVLNEFRENQAKPITDPSKTVFGPTLPQMIASALRAAGLLAGPGLTTARPGSQEAGNAYRELREQRRTRGR